MNDGSLTLGQPTKPMIDSSLVAGRLTDIVAAVLRGYRLPLEGLHGVAHWGRVLENGLRLAEQTEADVEVVSLFAVLHDARRLNEGHDPDHGARGAQLARRLRGTVFELPDQPFERLCRACEGHTHERTHPDLTIQTCWDADRLDLGRVGIEPEPDRLCTEAARHPEMIRWADRRACRNFVPDFVLMAWGIDLAAGESD